MAARKNDLGPDGLTKKAEPDGMTSRSLVEEDDVEGHSMLLNPTVGRELAKARSADIERNVRGKNNEAEAKRIFRRG